MHEELMLFQFFSKFFYRRHVFVKTATTRKKGNYGKNRERGGKKVWQRRETTDEEKFTRVYTMFGTIE